MVQVLLYVETNGPIISKAHYQTLKKKKQDSAILNDHRFSDGRKLTALKYVKISAVIGNQSIFIIAEIKEADIALIL